MAASSGSGSGAAAGGYFDNRSGEVAQLHKLIVKANQSRDVKPRKDVVKKVIAFMTIGVDVTSLFSDMVMVSGTQSRESNKEQIASVVHADHVKKFGLGSGTVTAAASVCAGAKFPFYTGIKHLRSGDQEDGILIPLYKCPSQSRSDSSYNQYATKGLVSLACCFGQLPHTSSFAAVTLTPWCVVWH